MNDIQESLLLFYDQMAKGTNTEGSQIIEGQVKKILDSGLGTYEIDYCGATFKAYSNNLLYKVDDMVYVLKTPDNDRNPRLILGISRPTASAKVAATKKIDANHIPIAGNILGEDIKVKLNSYSPDNLSVGVEGYNDKIGASRRFEGAITNFNTFRLAFKIKTNILPVQQNSGNYGIIIRIPFESGVKEFILDQSSYLGNMYHFEEEIEQYFDFSIGEGEKFIHNADIEVIAFQEGFLGKDNNIKTNDIFIKDIGLYAVQVISAEEVDKGFLVVECDTANVFADPNETSKTLKASLYLGGDKVQDLSEYQCYWYQEDISSTSDWRILNKVLPQSNQVEEKGTDVRKQYKLDDYEITIPKNEVFNINNYKCVLKGNGQKFEGKTFLSNPKNYQTTITIEGYDLAQVPKGLKELTLKCTTKMDNPTLEEKDFNLSYTWARYDKANQKQEKTNITTKVRPYYDIETNSYIATFTFDASSLVDFNTFKCIVSKITSKGFAEFEDVQAKEDGTYEVVERKEEIFDSTPMDEASLTVSTVSDAYTLTILNGGMLFKYDSDGDSPLSGNYDGPESNKIKELEPFKIRITRANGNQLTEQEYETCEVIWKIPVNSMFDGVSYDKIEDGYYIKTSKGWSEPSLPYSIKPNYDKTKSNNTIRVTVKFPESAETIITLNAEDSIIFTKDGETGTNGGKYSLVLTYNNYPYESVDEKGLPRKLRIIRNKLDNTTKICYNNIELKTIDEKDFLTFGLELYRNGVIVTGSDYTATWSIVEPKQNNPFLKLRKRTEQDTNDVPVGTFVLNDDLIKRTEKALTDGTSTIVQCTVVTGRSTENEPETITAYYPVETIITGVELSENNDTPIPMMIGGFDKAMYASDGSNPQYNNSKDFEIQMPALPEDISLDDYNIGWKSTAGIIINKTYDFACKATPKQKYDSPSVFHYIQADLSLKETSSFQNKISEKIEESKITQEAWKAIEEKFNTFNKEINNITQKISDYDSLLHSLNELKDSGFLLNLSNLYLDNQRRIKVLDQIKEIMHSRRAVREGVIVKITDTDIGYRKVPTERNINGALCNIITIDSAAWLQLCTLSSLSMASDASTLLNSNEYANINALVNAYNDFVADFNALLQVIISHTDYETYKTTIKYLQNNIDLIVNVFKKYPSSDSTFSNVQEVNKRAQELLKQENFDDTLANYDFVNMSKTLKSYFNEAYNVVGALIYSYNSLSQCIIKTRDYTVDNVRGFAERKNDEYILQSDLQEELIVAIEKIKLYQKAEKGREEGLEKSLLFSKNKGDGSFSYFKPILLYRNAYSMSYLADYTGTKLYIDEDDEQFLYAPQVGGCIKEDGKLTGMVLGKKNVREADKVSEMGMFGYHKGIQTMFLNSRTGGATFGASDAGQIIIDPTDEKNQGVIKSGNYEVENDSKSIYYTDEEKKYTDEQKTEVNKGMKINFTKPFINFGSGKFSVNEYGTLHAQNAYIEGHINAGDGYIGGWTIGVDNLRAFSTQTKSSGGTYEAEAGLSVNQGDYAIFVNRPKDSAPATMAKFCVGHDGILHSTGAIIEGSITATGGSIAGWTITSDYMSDGDAGIGKKGSAYAFWAGSTAANSGSAPFRVGHDGILTARGVNISGAITATSGSFSGDISANTFATNNNTFTVDVNGNVLANNISITGGNNFKIAPEGWIAVHTGNTSYATNASEVGMGGTDDTAIWAGYHKNNEAPFQVKYDGEVRMSKLYIQPRRSPSSDFSSPLLSIDDSSGFYVRQGNIHLRVTSSEVRIWYGDSEEKNEVGMIVDSNGFRTFSANMN